MPQTEEQYELPVCLYLWIVLFVRSEPRSIENFLPQFWHLNFAGGFIALPLFQTGLP
jgi:hypothetical protein